LNSVLFVGMFAGMASGAALGSLVLASWGWVAVALLAMLSAMGALLVRTWPARAAAAQPHLVTRL
jgi:predicted MFS family arabinose efflux permease